MPRKEEPHKALHHHKEVHHLRTLTKNLIWHLIRNRIIPVKTLTTRDTTSITRLLTSRAITRSFQMKSGMIVSKPICNSKSVELISYHFFTISPNLLLPLACTYFYPSNSPVSLNFNTNLLFAHEQVLIS